MSIYKQVKYEKRSLKDILTEMQKIYNNSYHYDDTGVVDYYLSKEEQERASELEVEFRELVGEFNDTSESYGHPHEAIKHIIGTACKLDESIRENMHLFNTCEENTEELIEKAIDNGDLPDYIFL